ncbi:MAG: hypothetical protein QG604_8 [Candidatus Dependentiae bacterium]|nr:hypothetical protein [Candidatus Dependentiae bacterium]
MVEQQTLNLQVHGSSPWRPTSLRFFTAARLGEKSYGWLRRTLEKVWRYLTANVCRSFNEGRWLRRTKLT